MGRRKGENRMKRIIILAVFVVFQTTFSSEGFSVDRDVCPACPYTSIQPAIDAAATGDRIRVVRGTYPGGLRFSSSKDVTLSGGWNSDFTFQARNPNLTVVEGTPMDQV